MPEYIYKHPTEDKYISIIQTMNEDHEYFEEGLEWKRVLTSPKLSTSSGDSIDPFDNNAFINKTSNMKGNYGDLIDQSREMSEKRASIHGGEDPLKRSHFDSWSEKRGGMIHPQDSSKRSMENKDVKIDF